MKRNQLIRSWNNIPFWVPYLVFGTIAAVLMIRQTVPLGLGISPDSNEYIRTARSLLENGYHDFGRDIGVVQPLGYPMTLAGAAWLTNKDPLDIAVVVNGFIAILIVVIFMWEARRLPGISPWLAGLIITFSLALSRMSAMALSELLFTLIVFQTLIRAAAADQGLRSAVLLGFMTFIGFLVKYIGVTLIPVVWLQLVIFSASEFRQRIRISSLYLMVSGILVAGYFGRNLLVAGSMWSYRPPSSTSFAESLAQTWGTITGWFFPEIPQSNIFLWILALVLVGFIWATRRNIMLKCNDLGSRFAIFPAFVLVNLTIINFLASRSAFDGLGTRLVSPVYPALAMTLLFLVAPGNSMKKGAEFSRFARWVLFLVLIAQPFRLVIKDTHRRGRDGGGGYNQPGWRNSELINECLPQLDLEGKYIFSNGRDVLYLLGGIDSEFMPQKGFHQSEQSTGVTADNLFDLYPDLNGSLLVYFYELSKNRKYTFTIEEMNQMCRLELIMKCHDGVVYKISNPGDD